MDSRNTAFENYWATQWFDFDDTETTERRMRIAKVAFDAGWSSALTDDVQDGRWNMKEREFASLLLAQGHCRGVSCTDNEGENPCPCYNIHPCSIEGPCTLTGESLQECERVLGHGAKSIQAISKKKLEDLLGCPVVIVD